MKATLRKKQLGLAAVAALLAASAAAAPALAYFTTYATAKGTLPLALGSTTTIVERVEDMTKYITIQNIGQTDCYVRVRVFGDGVHTLTITPGEGWTQEGEYWYYGPIVPAGGQTATTLQIRIEDLPEGESEAAYNIIVVQECVPVTYDENGDPLPADWSAALQQNTGYTGGA